MLFLTLGAQASTKQNSARVGTKYGHVTVGLGEAYAPVDFRVGANNWEFGLFHGRIIGVNYIQDFSNNFYMSLGGGHYSASSFNWDTISFYSGLGADFWKLWLVNFRSEIGMYTNFANYTGGKIMFGINVGY